MDGPTLRPMFPIGESPLFSSQLDKEETKLHRDAWEGSRSTIAFPDTLGLAQYAPARPDGPYADLSPSQRHRHRRWLGEREAMVQAIREATGDASRTGRFLLCGTGACVMASLDGQRFRVSCQTCKDRFCEPCMEERAWRCRVKLLEMMQGERHRMITLTLQGNERGLKENLDDLGCYFGKLRRTKLWKDAVWGGASFSEITRGAEGDHWHVHAHAVVHGTWMDKFELSAAWEVASGGSFIVHIRSMDEDKEGSLYAAKYATKGVSRGAVTLAADLREAIRVLSGRRLISTFGDWWRYKLDEDDEPKRQEREVAPFSVIETAAIKGEAWAVGVMKALRVKVKVLDGRAVYVWTD